MPRIENNERPRTAQTQEGTQWLNQHLAAVTQWQASGFRDEESLRVLVTSLRYLFELEPDCAALVRRLALSTAYASHLIGNPEQGARVAQIGLETVIVEEQLNQEDLQTVAYLACLKAELDISANAILEADRALRQATLYLSRLNKSAIATVLKAYKDFVAGLRQEEAGELGRATDSFKNAVKFTSEVLKDRKKIDLYIEGFGDLMVDDIESLPSQFQEQYAHGALLELIDLSALSRLHLTWMPAKSSNERNARSKAVFDLMDLYGAPRRLHPLDIGQALLGLSVQDASDRVGLIIQQREGEDDVELWHAHLYAALGCLYLESGEEDEGYDLLDHARDSAFEADSGLANLIIESHFLANELWDVDLAPRDILAPFLEACASAVTDAFDDLRPSRIKAISEKALEQAVMLTWDGLSMTGEHDYRVWLSYFLDTLRTPDWQMPLLPGGPEFSGESSAHAALAMAKDHLRRARNVLKDRKKTLAVILQEVEEDLVLFLFTDDHQVPVEISWAEPGFIDAGLELADAAEVQFNEYLDGENVDDSDLFELGQLTYDQLPWELLEQLGQADTLILIPDFSSESARIPFELIHDGRNFLGVSKIISRVMSVGHLVRSLESAQMGNWSSRALFTPVANVPGQDVLELADEECEVLQNAFQKARWDAPEVDLRFLSKKYVIERLKYLGLWHVASHGEVVLGEDLLMLGPGEALSARDIEARHFSSLPFVYMNACSVGQTHYMGGGVSRGLANALIEGGAPGALAHLSPVEDASAKDLALAFYELASNKPVGEALRLARTSMSDNGVPASCWGSTVLFGDTAFSLPKPQTTKARDDLVFDLLDAYTTPGVTKDRRAELYLTVSKMLDTRALSAVMLVRALSELGALDGPDALVEYQTIISTAEELNHLPTLSLLYSLLAEGFEENGLDQLAKGMLDRAIQVTTSIEHKNEVWGRSLLSLRSRRGRLEGHDPGIRVRTFVEPTDEDRELEDTIGDIFRAVRQQQAETEALAELRDAERTLEDIAWNAVVLGHPNRFGGFRETIDFAQRLAAKLTRGLYLADEAENHAPTMLAALLRFLWDKQNRAYLAIDFAGGQAGVLELGVHEIANEWSPPTKGAVLTATNKFIQTLDKSKKAIALAKPTDYENILSKETDKLERLASKTIASVKEKSPKATAGCAARILGSILEAGDDFEDLYARLLPNAEGWFWDLLMRGFEGVREGGADDLIRWMGEDIGQSQRGQTAKRARKKAVKKKAVKKKAVKKKAVKKKAVKKKAVKKKSK